MFVAREKELKLINEFLLDKGALLVYGLRRVGKTTLIQKAAKDSKKPFIYFECQKADELKNVLLLVDLLKEQVGFIDAEFNSFLSVIKEFNKLYPGYILIIDEYSLIKQYYFQSKKSGYDEKAEELDSEFQIIIDQHISNINLIISGSSLHIMKQLTEHKNPLYGRFTREIALSQFNYLDSKEMIPNLSIYEWVSFYSIFGGSPYVLERIDTFKSLKQNICELILDENGKLRTHLRNNVINELENDTDLHDILDVIKNGSKKYNEIKEKAHITTAGLLDKRLTKLLELDIIETKFPIGREDDKRKKYYQIKDNLLKFYYAYIFRQDNRINLLTPSRYYDLYIEPSLKEFISRRFENIVRDYFTIAISKGMYEEIVDIGSFFTSDNEYDCVLKKKNGKYSIYEVKYYKNPMTLVEQNKEIEQIKNIVGLDIDEIGFVCSSGFIEENENITYLDIDDIYFVDKKKIQDLVMESYKDRKNGAKDYTLEESFSEINKLIKEKK